MKSSGNIVFLGMMGSGKTTIGKLISKKLKKKFFDIDMQIEKVIGTEISEIFKKNGEKVFREFEEKITLDILKKKNIVIALGGGGFMNNKLRKEIISNHTSFWLNWSNGILLKRIINSSKRPVAFKSTKEELVDLIKKRSYIYSKALYKIDCNNLTKKQIVDKIFNLYETN